MKVKIAIFLALFTFVFVEAQSAHAAVADTNLRVRFTPPRVSDIGTSTAIVSLSKENIDQMDAYDLEHFYFEYSKTNQICIAIYPTPEYCLPKKTQKGVSSIFLKDLAPDTEYTVLYKRDNSINCITTPCPSNEIASQSITFKTLPTKSSGHKQPTFLKNFGKGSRGDDVYTLQNILISRGFLGGEATGYFGTKTEKAVKLLQKSFGLSQTGFVGPKTRSYIGSDMVGDYFSGKVTAVSTGCFSDGECSITVDGQKVVTAIGWSQDIVGSVKGVSGIVEVPVNAHANVFAKKTKEGFTLYGNKDYYVEIQFEQ